MGLSRTVSEINGDFRRKSQNFPTPCILRPPQKGFPLEFGADAGSQKLQGGPEKTAQTLMRYNFSTAGHRVTRFPAKCSETNW